ncbi:MAG: rhomboid family intramembrane serine protease [Nitrospinota bacterium]|nr:rhomboid family intramembrane serine protease [Nitrospinota bacterium]
MIPLYDTNPTKNISYITMALIVANAGIFFAQATSGHFNLYLFQYGVTPLEILNMRDVEPTIPYPIGITIITSMFLHGGLMHIAGNMLFLWIFGNNIEDIFGHFQFMLFYILCGIAAVFAHIYQFTNSDLPLVGASGAVSGILAAYLIAFPRAKVHTLFWFFIIVKIFPLPAWLLITTWFLVQIMSIGNADQIAWGSHVGGFLAGIILYPFFRLGKELPA